MTKLRKGMSQLMISKESFMLAWSNQKLVRGALKKAHVRLDYSNYDDLFQEGIIVYASILQQEKNLARAEVDRKAFGKIIWHTLDRLRQEQVHCAREVPLLLEAGIGQISNLNNWLELENEVKQMSEEEIMLFYRHLIENNTITSLAQETGISRGHLQRIKRHLLTKLQHSLEI
ncbi:MULTISPECIES: sigma-70 family RNA polymerase sigma factor [unclassified Lactobacillus]|uniref:sigma-70 family RNA polymerase sigma factor n=2 Tax=Lactobacillus TaxID=1578 RepID=UPI0011C481F3|nr:MULTISPECIES: sigma-70 family RNA polymerase sigma factor [unclassified Lactobacillus]